MTLQDIVTRHKDSFLEVHGHTLNADQWSAFNAILGCRNGQYGQIEWACSDCDQILFTPNSCGHRSCNLCQGATSIQWLERQQTKLLPVTYFMATFTLPAQLRHLARSHPKILYEVLITSAAQTLKSFSRSDAKLNGDIGFTAVLHTHTRRLDYHPHVHFIVPGGAINRSRKQWRKTGSYLFNGEALSRVFRGKFLHMLANTELTVPNTPKEWVVQCQKVGRGKEALAYLSRYLYRGVISNTHILKDDGEQVTFRYREGKTNIVKTRTVPAVEFIRLVLQHTLPKGFRRARDYGYLHGNARHLLRVVQWCLRVLTTIPTEQKPRAVRICRTCRSTMFFVQHHRHRKVTIEPG